MDDMEFVDLMFYSALAGATRAMLEARAPKRLVVRLREELLVLCQGYAAKSVRLSKQTPHKGLGGGHDRR